MTDIPATEVRGTTLEAQLNRATYMRAAAKRLLKHLPERGAIKLDLDHAVILIQLFSGDVDLPAAELIADACGIEPGTRVSTQMPGAWPGVHHRWSGRTRGFFLELSMFVPMPPGSTEVI